MESHKERKLNMCALSLWSRNALSPLKKKKFKGSHKTNNDLIDLIGKYMTQLCRPKLI